MKSSLFLLFLLLPIVGNAEGFARDSLGNINERVHSLALTRKQKEVLKTDRYIILTKEQQSAISKITSDTILQVLTEHYIGCTCQQRIGIWFHPDSIGVPYYIDYNERFEKDYLKKLKETGEYKRFKQQDSIYKIFQNRRYAFAQNQFNDTLSQEKSFFVSPNGEIYYKKSKITIPKAINLVDGIIEKYRPADEDDYISAIVTINWPPIYSNPYKRESIIH